MPALQNFVDKFTTVYAAWLNQVDVLLTTIFDQASNKAMARNALFEDAPLETTNGGFGSRDCTVNDIPLRINSSLTPPGFSNATILLNVNGSPDTQGGYIQLVDSLNLRLANGSVAGSTILATQGTDRLIVAPSGYVAVPNSPIGTDVTTVYTGLSAIRNTQLVITNDAVLSPDIHVTVHEPGIYALQSLLVFNGESNSLGGFRFDFNGGTITVGNSLYYGSAYTNALINIPPSVIYNSTAFPTIQFGGNLSYANIVGAVEILTPGTFALRVAQSTANAAPTNLFPISYFNLLKMA